MWTPSGRSPHLTSKAEIEWGLYQEQQQQNLVGIRPELDDDARVQSVKCAVFRGSS